MHALPPAVRDGVVETFAHSLHTVFLVAIPLAIVMFLLTLRLKEIPLRGHDGDQPHPVGEGVALAFEGATE